MDISTITSLASHLSTEGTLILVLVLVGERLVEKGWLKLGKGEENADGTIKKTPTLDSISSQMSQLQHHFNDDTTRLLSELLAEVKNTNRSITEGFGRISDKFSEYDKYGIKSTCAK